MTNQINKEENNEVVPLDIALGNIIKIIEKQKEEHTQQQPNKPS